MTTQQPEALRLANILRGIDTRSRFSNERLSSASDALENQHARITDLESQLAQAQPAQARAGAEPLDEARRLFDAGWKAAALFCDREDVVADGIIGFGACPQFEEAFRAARKQGASQ